MMVSAMFQRSLGIRDDGRCQRHPDVPLLGAGSSCVGSCHLCAMEAPPKEKGMDDATYTTRSTSHSNSYVWPSASSLSLGSSIFQPQQHPKEQQQNSPKSSTDKTEQQFLESIISRWVQVQHQPQEDGSSINPSLALGACTPLILHELRTVQAKVAQQEVTIQEQQKTIQELRSSMEQQHNSTQELLQTILQNMSSSPEKTGHEAMDVPPPPSTVATPGHTPHVSKKSKKKQSPSKMSSKRSVDSGVRQPLTRHDSNLSFTITQHNSEAPTPITRNRNKPLPRQQAASPKPAQEIELFASSHQSKNENSYTQLFCPPEVVVEEIAFDGSHTSFGDRSDMPDCMAAIFEEGMGAEIGTGKKKKFQLPACFTRRQSKPTAAATAAPQMEIIVETAPVAAVKSKVMPSSPQEVGLQSSDNDIVFDGGAGDGDEDIVVPGVGVGGGMVTLDSGNSPGNDSDLSESDCHHLQGGRRPPENDSDDDEEEDGDQEVVLLDQEPNDYDFENLEHVSGYTMMDMYGDIGTYTGTLSPDKEPAGFGTMKYESGRFFKGEWKKGRWNGKGTLLNANGDSYQGDFVGDARHGWGVYRFTSGDVYEGDFSKDNRHGQGKFKFHNGSVYTGEFCMGSFEGFGRYDFEGGYYEGEWRRDEYYGKGKLQYEDGSNYEGRFKRGSAHGFGEERLADGTVRRGLWKRGEFLLECTEEEYGSLEPKSHGASRRGTGRISSGDAPPDLM